MNQIINIFRKDLRQNWYVMVLPLAVLAAFTKNEPSLWLPQAPSVPSHLREYMLHRIYSAWLEPLVVIGWMILIVRVVHGESLVGDRQFWITRPYQWKKLLIAKVLFFVAFINLPLLVVQVVLLWKAGFAPTSYVTGLLWTQFLWFLVLILPTTAVATTTSSFGQTVLIALAIPLLLIGGIALSTVIPGTGLGVAYSIQEAIQNLVLLGASVGVVIRQYARRGTLYSRLLLISAALVALVIMVATPRKALTAYMYPQPSASQRPPVQLVFDPARQTTKEGGPMEENEVGIRLPLLVRGRLQDSAVDIDGMMVEIEAPGGLHWQSGWQQGYSTPLPPSQLDTYARFGVEKGFFEKVKSSSAKLHIWFALSISRVKEINHIVLPTGEFTTQDGALCSINSYEEQPNNLQCRAAGKHSLVYVTTVSEETTCPKRQDERLVPPGTIFFGWQQILGSQLGFDPVSSFSIGLLLRPETPENFRARLCPGTPLMLRTLEEAQRTRSELTIDGISLADYQLKDSPPGQTMIGIRH